jgi:hypothetical protein
MYWYIYFTIQQYCQESSSKLNTEQSFQPGLRARLLSFLALGLDLGVESRVCQELWHPSLCFCFQSTGFVHSLWLASTLSL